MPLATIQQLGDVLCLGGLGDITENAQRPDGFRYVGLTSFLAVLKERILCCFHVLEDLSVLAWPE